MDGRATEGQGRPVTRRARLVDEDAPPEVQHVEVAAPLAQRARNVESAVTGSESRTGTGNEKSTGMEHEKNPGAGSERNTGAGYEKNTGTKKEKNTRTKKEKNAGTEKEKTSVEGTTVDNGIVDGGETP